jgi:hypothetical protein
MAKEIKIMPEIYTNAYITISASSASSCHEGFLATRCLDRRSFKYNSRPWNDFVPRYQENGVVGLVHVFSSFQEDHEPADRRAWTFQERELSPRYLEFGSHQVRWAGNSRSYYDGGFKDRFADDKESTTMPRLLVTCGQLNTDTTF